MKPNDENNYLIEVTPETMHEINILWMHSEQGPVVELHYSPNWKERKDDTEATK